MNTHTDPPNSAADHGDDELLPCGTLLSRAWDVWEQDGDDEHARSCPHCRQAVRELDDLESAVRGLRRETTDESDYDPEPLTRRVMDLVRLELRPGRPLPLGDPTEGVWIMEAVAARSIRATAERVPGVRAGSCRLLSADGGVRVRLDIHAPAGVPLPELADHVRERVREGADRALGMVVAAVDIEVIDIVAVAADDEQNGSHP
ncbi:Asp23/Gls24 family envelope stress response protein [Streptomyces sp. VRA16 Mangrove soil]|uniref:Asp23/Gls24 family envelope stress response protein n=1 Tax=Streptomyces sp. VRA16 Mangrove soil TaxID=2817434 RepID=UPI001A9F3A98|nr:Asp23/Gls24 family envelope stress response protein [Streptomyces sp. VRA16 Mangrove soil]MBO1337956.1 Asp23/Gls24 family envelope stress response protein [Streptomyces sp. VRA16 Mangrove soil]